MPHVETPRAVSGPVAVPGTHAPLPAAAKLWGLDTVVVLRTLLLNGIAGVVFGWLYWKRGLEMAMLSHFSADIVLHVIAPLFSPGASP